MLPRPRKNSPARATLAQLEGEDSIALRLTTRRRPLLESAGLRSAGTAAKSSSAVYAKFGHFRKGGGTKSS